MNVHAVSRAMLFVLAVAFGAGSLPVGAQCDTAAPGFTAFGFSPSSINTTLASQNVTCTITVTDSPAGVASAGCSFQSPSFLHTASCSSTTPTSGTPQNGTYSCIATLPRYAEAGVWKANLNATDAVGNTASLSWFQFPGGFPTDLTVTSDPDTVPPALTNFTLSPTAINTSSAAQNVTCNMTVTDAKSGVSAASCFYTAPGSSQSRGCTATAPTSGTPQSGTFSCVTSFPQYSDAGTWTTQVLLTDAAGNNTQTVPSATLAVTSVPEDVTGPSETTFDFNPKSVSVGSSSKTVTCTMTVADSPSGVNVASCDFSFTDMTTFTSYQQGCSSGTPSSGTRNNGTFTCTATIPRYSDAGSWTVDSSYIDLTGNQNQIAHATPLNVDCGAGVAETTCRFADHNTLTWDVVSGATRYNIYRGFVSGLTDANADHLPDGGYGTCQNSRDPNLTDTTFVDTDVPTTAQIGFHYLVSYTSGGVEKGLGTNSFGTARTVSSPCP